MQVGYNHNIKHKGKEYHIQTEDSGESTMMITTLLYCDGTIVGSKKTNYGKVAAEYEDYGQQLKELMQKQHKKMLINLKNGDFDDPELADLEESPADKAKEEKLISEAIKETEESKEEKSGEPAAAAKNGAAAAKNGAAATDVNEDVDKNSSDFADEILHSLENILKNLTQKNVELTKVTDELINLDKMSLRFDDNIVLSQTKFNGAITSDNAFIFDIKTGTTLADLILLGDGATKDELTPDDIDAVKEAMNQTFGAAVQAVLNVYGLKVSYDPINVSTIDAKENKSELEGLFDVKDIFAFNYSIKVEDKIDSSVYFYITTDIKEFLQREEDKAAASDSSAHIISEDETSVTKAEDEVEKFDSQGYIVGKEGEEGEEERELRNVDLIKGIEVDVKIKLGDAIMPLKKIYKLAPGAIIELNKDVDSLLELVVNNKTIAEGVLVVVSTNNFAVRLTNIIDQAARIKNLGGSGN